MTLKVDGICKRFKDVKALKTLDFTLEPGGSLALLGPNGAGKSTAIKILVSLLRPDGGSYQYGNEDLLAKPAKIRDLIGYVSQELAMDKMLTGSEFMRFCAGLFHLDWKIHKARAGELLKTMGLEEAKDRPVGDYSGGMKRRLDLAVAMLHQPKILVLDEPTTGLDVEAKDQIWGLIRDYVKQGGSLILASHDFREVQELADEVLVLNHGEIVLRGKADQMKAQVGDFIIRVKSKEFMNLAEKQAVNQAMKAWGDKLTTHTEEDFATFAVRDDRDMSQIQQSVYETLKAANVAVHSVNIQKPDLEDAYRFTLGGQS